MAITTAEELAQRALEHGLVDEFQMQRVWNEFGSRNVTLDEFRKALLGRDFLTFFQVEHLIAENRTTFYYGDYKVLYLVGTGTFARVYRATHTTTKHQAAVKVLRKRFSESREEAERFQREGEVGMTLKHPNIVPIYEVGKKNNDYWMVIEFIEGQNLRDFMKVRKAFEPEQATRLALDICRGLDYAFQRGIFHRDMKASNVLISSRGQAKLVDFGLAGADKNQTEEALAKNPNPRAIDYAGLERSSGVHKNDPRSDIFFVGCIYYEMLSGHMPLAKTSDRAQRLSKGRYQDIPSITQIYPEVSRECATIVNKAISFDPERRYQTPAEMAAELTALLSRMAVANAANTPDAIDEGAAAVASAPIREGVDASGKQRTIMLVESDLRMQDALRELLKRNGYRVLVVSDPQRAVARATDERSEINVAIFSTGAVGQPGLEAFQEFAGHERTQKQPAILLLGERQRPWSAHVAGQVADHRMIAVMPITQRQLRETLVKVIAASEALQQQVP